MTVTYDKTTKKFTIVIDADLVGTLSASEKSRVHASTRGNVTTSLLIGDKPLVVGINAYTRI